MRFLRFFPVLCFLLLSGCAREKPVASTPVAPQTIQTQKFPRDDLGREIKLQKPAKRVVCIGPGATETIFALGAGSQLVGRDQVSDYPAAALKVAIAGDYNGPFIEKVIALRPDLVIVQGETYDKVRAENWQKKIGAPVAILAPQDLGKVARGIEKIGAWLGVKKTPQILAKKFDAILIDAGLEGEPRVFFEVQRSPLWTAGRGTLIYDVIARARLANVALDTQGYKVFNIETLLTRQPDVYIVSQEKPDLAATLADLKKHPILKRLKCVQKNRVVVVPSSWVLRPGPRLLQGVTALQNATKNIQPQSRN